MADGPGTLELLAQQVGIALQPLESQLTATNVIPLFAQLGLQFPAGLTSNTPFMNAVSAGATAAGALTNLLTQLATDIQNGDDAAIIEDGIKIIQAIGAIVSALEQIGALLPAAAAGSGIDPGEVATFAGALAENLLSYLLISYLETTQPGALGVANLLGVVDYIPMPGVTGDPTHPAYIIRRLNLSNVGNAISSPSTLIQTLYDWGNTTFDGTKLFPRLGTSLNLLGAPATVNAAGNALNGTYYTLGVNSASTPPGIAGTLNYPLPQGFTLTLPLSPTLSIQITVQGTFNAGIGLMITPPAQVALKPSATLNGQLTTALTDTAPDADHPIIIVGQTGGSRMQTTSWSVGAGLPVTWDSTSNTATADPVLTAAVKGGLVVIDMSSADGFLADVLSGVHVQGAFDLGATWRADSGLHVTGGAQLEIDLPLHVNLGPATLSTLYLVGGIANSALTLEVSAGLGITLGPIQAAVDRVGLLGTMTFPSSDGNLGFANLALGFKPPNGLGLAIDAGVVTGGGYISFDPVKGQYAGIIALTLVDTIGLTVITVLNTVMPDGSSGFSLLFIITFTLPPIQLGFGFTLTGVGGLGGVNRSMSQSALEAGFLAHTLDAIMFPPDPIANASQIVSDIQSFFPPAQGRYLFGPLLQISWGTPTLLSFSIAAILEVPDPILLALLGLIEGGLPDLDSELIELHIDVLGIIDFGAKTVSIDGSLYDSRVLEFSLGGSLCFRWGWGGNPNFVFSLGGFNPAFNTDGLNLPPMTRLSISIGAGDNPRISANAYFAVTSNSLQWGANVQAYASAGGFSISGYLGFDVLFIRSPFSFEFDFQASFDVAYDGTTLAGLSVDGLFSGPTPWHFHGSASISFLFFSVSASLDLTWGDSTQATIPAMPVLPDLFAALAAPANWSAALPAGAAAGVSLVTLKPTDTTLRVHPMGTLTVHEHVVPLDLPITRYGGGTPADGTEFSIQGVTVDGTTATTAPIQDYFAVGQFETLSDADKLSKPSFENFDAGVTIGSATVLSGQDRPRTVTYQEYYIDEPTTFSRFTGIYKMPGNIHLALSAQGAGASSPFKHTGLAKYSVGPQATAITTQDPPYVVATITDLTVRADIAPGEGTTYLQAQAAVKAYLFANPNAVGTLQIVPLYEIAA